MLTRSINGMGATLILLCFFAADVDGQQDVSSRDDSGVNNWNDAANPWHYDDGTDRQRPDEPLSTRNDVYIGHDAYNPMTVNGDIFDLRTITFENSITIDRIYNSSGAGISLSVGLYNESGQLQTLNVPVYVDGAAVAFEANSGDLIFNDDFYLNANTGSFAGAGNTTITGVIAGIDGEIVKDGAGTLILTNENTYTGTTTVNAGNLSLDGVALTNQTIPGHLEINGGTVFYGNLGNEQISDGSDLLVTAGTVDFAAREETINSLNVDGGNVERGGAALTLNAPSSFTGGTITFSSLSSRFNLMGTTTLGTATFIFTGSTAPNIVLDAFGDFETQGTGTTSFDISGSGSPGINLNNAVRTFNVIGGTSIEMGWRLRSTAPSQGGINKAGGGVMSINHTAEYTGPTRVSEGILRLGAADVMHDGSSLELNGGTFSTGETSGFEETMGTLNLQDNSTIALGSGTHIINFAASNGTPWDPGATLTITGWSGDLGQAGTAVKIFIGTDASSLTQEQLNQIEFDGQGFAILLPDGELVPRNPTFSVSETYLLPLSTPEGTPSEAYSFDVEGTSLTTDITITAPAGFEMALNAGGPYSNPLTITVTDLAGNLASTEVFLRLTGDTQGAYSGDLIVSTSGLPDKTVAVGGRVLTPGSAVIRFDDGGNWDEGSGGLESYQTDHEHTEQDWIFTGGPALRESDGVHDGFPSAYNSFSWRLGENNVTWTGAFTNSGTINAFGFKVRRWDNDPSPDYEVAYSTNGGTDFTVVETIDNAYLDNSSQWKVFEHELGTPVSIGANDFVVRLSQPSGERIFIDDFSFDLTADDCDNETWYYRSVTSGSYTNKLTWEKSSTGASWEPADCPPNENAAEVLVRDGHNVLVNTGIAIPSLIIEGNALLRIDAGTIDMSAGAITINSNGILEFDGGEVPVFPSSGIGITVDGTLRVSTAVGGISSALAGNGSSGKVSYADGSVFEWNIAGAAAFQTSGQTYFPDVDVSTIPIFSIPQSMGIAGASSNTIINGVFQVDGSMTWNNSGEKQIRNGITGSGTITQSALSGVIRLTAPNAVMSGSGALALNSNGLLIPSGVTVDLQSDKPVNNASSESGRVEINGVLNDNGFGMPGDIDNVVIGSTGVINCTNLSGLIATGGTFGSTGGAYSIDANSLVDYQRPGDQDVTTVSDYGNLTIRGSGTKTITNGATSVLGDLLLDGSALISAIPGAELSFTNDMTVSGTASFDSGAHDNLALSTSGENIQNINGNANPIRCLSFLSVKANGSLTLNGISAMEVKGEWDTDYYTTGNFTNNGATLQVGGDMRIRGGDFDRYSITGTVRLTGETETVQVFRGTDDSPVSAVIENLIVGGSGSPNVNLDSSGEYTFTGNISIENGQLNAFDNQINLAGNWLNYGEAGFNENLSRLFLNGVSDQTITCPGGEIFSSLTVDNNAGDIVLNDNLNLTGIDSEIIDLNAGAVINLGGNTLRFSGNNGENPGTLLRVSDGNALITGTPGSIFEVVNGTKQVVAVSSGGLEFDDEVTVLARSGIDFAAAGASIVKGVLEINSGGSVLNNPPLYFTNSTLRYNTGGDFDRNAEWNSITDPGIPYNLEIAGATNLYLSNVALPGAVDGRLEILGDLIIEEGTMFMGGSLYNGLDVKGDVLLGETEAGNLNLGDNDGEDIRIGGNLNLVSGTLIQNSREVEMNGIGNTQNITGVDSFDYLAINNSGGTVIIDQETTIDQRLRLAGGILDNTSYDLVMSDGSLILRTAAIATLNEEPAVAGGDQFNIEYAGSSFATGNEFPTANTVVANVTVCGSITTALSGDLTFNGDLVLNESSIDLNGNTFTARGNAPTGTFAGEIVIDGGSERAIENSGLNQAYFDITGTGGEASEFYTKQVESLNGTSLVFEDDITVRLGNGGVDFGNGNPTTIEGVLEVSAGGFVINHSCYYAENSILRFANGFSYEVDPTDKTWGSGDISSGNPGIPYNVESSGDNATILTLNSPRSLRKNLTINGSQFTLTSSSGIFELGGNWNRSGASSLFNHNNQEVVFNGAGPQTITTSDGVASEVFYKLTFSGDGLKTLNEDVTVEDAITIDGAGGLDLNEQTIFLHGDWINAAGESAFAESGRVELLGSAVQTITCSGGEKFDTLRVDNSSALGEGIDLVHPISISGQLIMDRGLIHNDGVQDLTLTATASTNGGDFRSYVTGKIVKQGFATTDLVEFPVGFYDLNGGDTISVWQKAGLTPENADATSFSVQYFHENAVPGTSYPSNPPEVQSPLLTASTCNFWDIDRLSGASGARIRLHWNDSTSCFDIGDPATLVVAHLNGSDQWESAGMDGQSSISPFDEGYVESDMITSFSPFAIGTTSGINVLPITLLNFTAEAREATVELQWTTSSEINNDFFTVERSLDAENFETVGTIAGAGNSNTQLYYNFSDDAPYSGISFYRLKQTDFDGTSTYSDIRMVRVDSDGDFELLKVYPAQDGLQLHYRSEVNDLDVEIFDLTGKHLFRKNIQNTGATTIHPGLAKGVYLLRISNGTEFRVGKFFY